MPTIILEGGKLSKEQKSKLVKDFTTTAAQVMNIPEQAFTVFIKENDKENVGVGGVLIADK
ncbi:MAG: 4-oxalocrotonate tautomerase family protein [Spirochaetaceae bacterium]|nr:4-oxalocrotonate tautomerase family protein [Spirochaetaceae bacterium]